MAKMFRFNAEYNHRVTPMITVRYLPMTEYRIGLAEDQYSGAMVMPREHAEAAVAAGAGEYFETPDAVGSSTE